MIGACLLLATALYAQRGFRGRFYEEEDVPIPADASERTEYVFARLRYDAFRGGGYYFRGGSWATDINNAGMIPNYAERRRYGERVSTAFVESTVNVVVGKRFSKRPNSMVERTRV